MWPAQFWLWHEGRVQDALIHRCLAVRNDDILREELFERLSQSGARMERLIDLVEDQIGLKP
jgi:hypothetical protein